MEKLRYLTVPTPNELQWEHFDKLHEKNKSKIADEVRILLHLYTIQKFEVSKILFYYFSY